MWPPEGAQTKNTHMVSSGIKDHGKGDSYCSNTAGKSFPFMPCIKERDMSLSFMNQASPLVLLLIFGGKNGEEEGIAYLTVPFYSAGLLYLWQVEQRARWCLEREVQRANVSLILQSQFLQHETSEGGKG